MLRYIIVGLASGLLFAILDGVIHANPLARKLYAVYQPIARTSLNPLVGLAIDIAFGFIMAIVFLLIRSTRARSQSIGKNIPFWTAFWLLGSMGHGSHSGSWSNFNSGSGGFGGGFGGFGGGSFGGGGAGGSW